MIVPVQDRDLLRIYECGVCGDTYSAQTGPTRYKCAAVHPPGSCCHEGEKRVLELRRTNNIWTITLTT